MDNSSLIGKQILLGVSGGIAAYKSPDLVRRLQDAGAAVRVVLTESACAFVTPLTFQAVSGFPVSTTLLDDAAEAGMGHIELARWADLILIAPATANCIARLAGGMADDLLTTITLASPAPVVVAPAMNQQMWANSRTQHNLQVLQQHQIGVIQPGVGDQACGDTGAGRLPDTAELVTAAANAVTTDELSGRRVLITAGPTMEPLDPVRALTNFSTGKMGYAIAAAAAQAGAQVTLVSGPVCLATPAHVQRIDVRSALDMHDAVHAQISDTDIFIAVAAVADYRPATSADQKIKKDADTLTINLVRNPDILASVTALDNPPFAVGFAAETQSLETHAQEKLRRKKLDMIVANKVGQPGTGFGADDNAFTVIDEHSMTEFERAPKSALARQLIKEIASRLNATDKT